MTDVKRSEDILGGVWDCLLTYCGLVPSISNFECLEARPGPIHGRDGLRPKAAKLEGASGLSNN